MPAEPKMIWVQYVGPGWGDNLCHDYLHTRYSFERKNDMKCLIPDELYIQMLKRPDNDRYRPCNAPEDEKKKRRSRKKIDGDVEVAAVTKDGRPDMRYKRNKDDETYDL